MATHGDFVAFVRQIAGERDLPLPIEGFVDANSWNPQQGTVRVIVGHTAAMPLPGEDIDANDPFNTAVVHDPVQLLTNHLGDQGGPIGGERCILFPYENGHSYVAMLFAGDDDSPQVPQGEKHIYLRSKDASLAMQCFLKVQEDAVRIGHQQKIVLHAPTMSMGTENPSSDDGIVNKKILQVALDSLTQQVQQAINGLAQTVQPGSGVPPPNVQKTTAQGSSSSFTV